jgi:ASC-1-like (ASCH) protein
MKILALAAAALLSAAALNAAELNGISAADIKVSKLDIPAPVLQLDSSEKCGHVTGEITKLHLYAQASKSMLFTYAKTEAETKEFTAMWTPILEKFGMKVTGTEYKTELFMLKYESADGRVVRMFNADRMNYDALSSTTIAALQHEVLEPLEQAGMTPIASFSIKNDVFRPTFNIYYLTQPDENRDHEVQLRQMKHGDDIAFDLLANSVTIVKKDSSFSMVYIGKLLGYKAKLAADEAGIQAKLEEYKKYLAENKKEFIGSITEQLDEPFTIGDHTYKYAVGMYFFQ